MICFILDNRSKTSNSYLILILSDVEKRFFQGEKVFIGITKKFSRDLETF